MLVPALGLLAVLAVFAVAGVLVRRRNARGPALALRTGKGRAGVSHLATRVSELSDLGLHLRAATAPRRRLGALLGLR